MNASFSPAHRASLLISAMIAVLITTGCATAPVEVAAPGAPAEPMVPRLGFFSRIKAPEAVAPVLQLASAGVQIFRCEKRDNGFVWNFRQPEADLSDPTGRVVARHGANFSFEHADGSRLIATVIDFDEPPQSGDLRWLLLSSRAFGEGAFAGVTHVQRVNTMGGMPPPRCDASQSNQILRVKFTADFIFYRPR
jgi:hypothetical protein